MKIQWFPGHMAKTIRILSENLKLVDVVIELLDARIPFSSKNPNIDSITNNKPRIIALNKADLADNTVSKKWCDWYKSKGFSCVCVDSVSGKGLNDLKEELRKMMKEKLERDKSKGRIFTPIRTMVLGVPNVGKSTFINKITGRSIAVTADKPGVTRHKLWIKINREFELMDTPGILWPKFDNAEIGKNLAYTGAIKDEIYDTIEIASLLMQFMKEKFPDRISERYKLKNIEEQNGMSLLNEAAKNRGCIIAGGELDLMRISAIVLDEFRSGKLGKISLESPEDGQK